MNEGWDSVWALQDEFIQAVQDTAIMVGVASTIGIIFGGALGIWLYLSGDKQLFQNRILNSVLNWVIRFMRAFPFVILMIALMPVTRAIVGTSFGPFAASVALSLAAIFYFARLMEQNLNEVPRGVIEAAEAMGTPPRQIITKVLLNETRSGVALSITMLIIAVLGESAAAGLIGGGGIGDLGIRYGHQRYMPEVMYAVLILLTAIVIVIQTTGNKVSKALNKR